MPITGTFGNILNGLSLMNKDNARDAAAMQRQKEGDKAAGERASAGDAAQLARLLKSLEHASEQAQLGRAFDTANSNIDWARSVEREMERRSAAEAEAERDRQLRRELQGSEFQHRERMPGIETDAKLTGEERAYNRNFLRSMQAADALGGDLSMAYDIADPNVGRALQGRALRSLYEKNPLLAVPGAGAAMIRSGYLEEDDGGPFGGKKPGAGTPPKPLGNINR